MRLLTLEKGRWKVAAVIKERDNGNECPVLEFIQGQSNQYKGSAKGFRALFRRYACLGRDGLTRDQFHLANREEKIWEFIKGQLRIFCFEDDDGALIILTHGTLKKSQKADRLEVARALEAKRAYAVDKAARQLIIQDGGE